MTTQKITKTAVYSEIKTLNVEGLDYVHQYEFTDSKGRDWEAESNPSNNELIFYRKGNYGSRIVIENMTDKKQIAKRIAEFINSL